MKRNHLNQKKNKLNPSSKRPPKYRKYYINEEE